MSRYSWHDIHGAYQNASTVSVVHAWLQLAQEKISKRKSYHLVCEPDGQKTYLAIVQPGRKNQQDIRHSLKHAVDLHEYTMMVKELAEAQACMHCCNFLDTYTVSYSKHFKGH
jgi:hypothetical protein